jgi:hypothetical protein
MIIMAKEKHEFTCGCVVAIDYSGQWLITYCKEHHGSVMLSPPVKPEPQVICPECKGSGQLHIQHGFLNDTPAIVEIIDCPNCEGSGKLLVDGKLLEQEVESKKEIIDWIEQRGDLHFEFPFGQITKSEWLIKKKEWCVMPKK